MIHTSVRHANNVLNQLNSFYWFYVKQKNFLSYHTSSKVAMESVN